VGDAVVVRSREARGDLAAVLDRLAQREVSGGDDRAQRFALEKFGDDEYPALMLPQIVDVEDVGVIESGRGTGLAFESAKPVGFL
jgi:hypothetical protein